MQCEVAAEASTPPSHSQPLLDKNIRPRKVILCMINNKAVEPKLFLIEYSHRWQR
jgi:hypothetical protein